MTSLYHNVTRIAGVNLESIQKLGQSFLLAAGAKIRLKVVFNSDFIAIILAEKGSAVEDFRRRTQLNEGGEPVLADLN